MTSCGFTLGQVHRSSPFTFMTTCEADTIIFPDLYMKQLRPRKVKKLAQSHTAKQWDVEGGVQAQTRVVCFHRTCEHEQVLSSLTLSFLV